MLPDNKHTMSYTSSEIGMDIGIELSISEDISSACPYGHQINGKHTVVLIPITTTKKGPPTGPPSRYSRPFGTPEARQGLRKYRHVAISFVEANTYRKRSLKIAVMRLLPCCWSKAQQAGLGILSKSTDQNTAPVHQRTCG